MVEECCQRTKGVSSEQQRRKLRKTGGQRKPTVKPWRKWGDKRSYLNQALAVRESSSNGRHQHSGVPQHRAVLAAALVPATRGAEEADEVDKARWRRPGIVQSEGEGGAADAEAPAEGAVGAAAGAGVDEERVHGFDAVVGRRGGASGGGAEQGEERRRGGCGGGVVGEEDAEGEADEHEVGRLREEDDAAHLQFDCGTGVALRSPSMSN
ncbi:hypothetical protein Cni_G26344 [Canna indica]|uniref:Uncharacterized protein n=1 Tax=Canna indica TaxID=4628 RepID=A0AAQ3QQE0_9LILI|nr:hypothetical protein Cni_G26344 [Canna indica]